MRRAIKLLAASALAAAICSAAGGLRALAAPMPTAILAWEVTQSKTMTASDPPSYSGNVQIDEKDSSGQPIILDLGGMSLTISGNLDILGTLYLDNGTVTINGNVSVMNGTIKMVDSNSRLVVKGNFTTDGKDETGLLTAGSLTVYGDFMQYGDFSRSSFCPSGTFAVTLTGSNKLVWFDTPDASWLNGIPPATVTYKSNSVISLKVDLTSIGDKNFASPYSYPHLCVQGALGGKTMTVPDGARISGPLMMGGGRLFALGSLTVDGAGSIGMENANDFVEVDGNFTAGGHSDYQAGEVEVVGNFHQASVVTDSSYHDDSYACLPAHKTVLVGQNKTVAFDTPGSSYFGQMDASQASFTPTSTISLNCDLGGNTSWSYPNLYYGGNMKGYNLTVSGDLHARTITLGGGTLTVNNGSFFAASDNCLIMHNTGDRVVISRDFTSRYAMDPASLSAGVLQVGGNFYQLGDATAFTASGTHVTKLTGSNKYVSFTNPGASYFNRLDLSGGVTFASASVLSVKCDLASDLSVGTAGYEPTLYYSGNLGGHSLYVDGNLHIGTVDPLGGSISATGDVTLDGTLTMTHGSDSLTAGGDFTGAGTAALSAGTAEFMKSFHYTGSSYNVSGTHLTELSGGNGMPVLFDDPADGWFSQVDISQGTTLSPDSAVSIKTDGQSDITLTVPTLYLQSYDPGDPNHPNGLNGRHVTVDGSLFIPAGTILKMGGGSVQVSGDMTAAGTLVMQNAADQATVGGDFYADSPDETGDLTDGILSVKGDFIQQNGNSDKSFVGSGNHATVLCGDAPQTVSFESPASAAGASDGSKFGRLYRLNSAIEFTTSYFASNGPDNRGVVTSADLQTLSGAGGTGLFPALAAGTTDYIYVLPPGVTDATISAALKYPSNATMTINGNPAASPASADVSGVGYHGAGNQTVNIVVKAADNIVSNQYVVKVEQLDPDLTGIGLSTGTLSPAFDPAAQSQAYSVDLPSSVGSVTITPAPDNPDSTVMIGSVAGPARTLTPSPGETIVMPIVVTGQDGTTTRQYSVSVHREPMLSGISATAGTLSPAYNLSAPQQNYTLTLPAAQQTAVTLTAQEATGANQGYDSITAGGQPGNSAQVTLPIGAQQTVDIAVTAGSSTFTYHVTVLRRSILSGFGYYPTAGTTLTPAFDAAGGTYTLTIPASMNNVTLTPPKDDCSELDINGLKRDSFDVSPPVGGSVSIPIVAYDSTGAVHVNYTLNISRLSILSGIAPSAGTLTPAFSPTTLNYTIQQPATMDPMALTPTLLSGSAYLGTDPTALQLWDPQSPDFIDPMLDPDPGTTGCLYVSARDGAASALYTVSVVRQMPLAGIDVSGGMALSPSFNARTPEYTVMMPAYTSSVTITPKKSAGCTNLTINGVAQDSVVLSPPIGGSTSAVICATGPDGSTISTYTVSVVRDALLSDIKASTGSLSPAFQGGVSNYNVYLPESTASITLTPQKSSSCQSFTINGKNVSKIKLTPKPGNSDIATIACTGTGFGVYQTYSVTVYRIEPVTGIGVSSGKLSPAFSMAKGSYTVNVAPSVSSVTVTPVTGSSDLTMQMDGQTLSSKPLSMDIGCSASTTITALSRDGQHYSYTVTVNRLALLKGITVPTSPSYAGYTPSSFLVTNYAYSMTVPATTASVKVTPLKGPGAKSMKINGKTASYVTLKPVIGGSATASIVVANGTANQTYTLTVYRLPLLTSLATAAGTLSQTANANNHAFDAAVTNYTVTLPADTANTTLTAAQAPSGVQSITMNGAQTLSLPVTVNDPGGSTTVTIVATASDGTTKGTYTVVVQRDSVITGIQVTNGTLSPAFSPVLANYTVSVPATTASVTLKPLTSPDCTFLSIDGISVSIGTGKAYPLPVGGGQNVTIVGKTAGGQESDYTVWLYRAPLVSNIKTSSSSCPVSPAFIATTQNYTVTLPVTKSSATIYATKAKGVKTLTMDGHKVTSYTVTLGIGCSKTFAVTATATDGTTVSTYNITVVRTSLLSSISVTGGSLNTPFATGTHYYTVTIPAAQATPVVIGATGSSVAGTIKINGGAANPVTIQPPAPGYSTIVTIVVYETGSTTVKDTYTVVVTKSTV